MDLIEKYIGEAVGSWLKKPKKGDIDFSQTNFKKGDIVIDGMGKKFEVRDTKIVTGVGLPVFNEKGQRTFIRVHDLKKHKAKRVK
jgi:hypothetical protein